MASINTTTGTISPDDPGFTLKHVDVMMMVSASGHRDRVLTCHDLIELLKNR